MLFYNKGVKLSSGSSIKVSYTTFSKINTDTDENILPLKYAKSAFNFNIENGALKTGIGFEDLTLPESINSTSRNAITLPASTNFVKLWQFKRTLSTGEKAHKLVVMAEDGNLFAYDIFSSSVSPTNLPYSETFNENDNAINYRLNGTDTLIFLKNQSGGIYTWTGAGTTLTHFSDAPQIADMCIHAERLFAVDSENRQRLWFSDDLDPTNWTVSSTDAGFIDLVDERGDLKRVFAFNDYVYILREYGISRLSGYGDQSQFSVTHCHSANSKIYNKTACLCGNSVIYLAKDGLYSFNGITASKINVNIDKMFSSNNENAVSAFHNGKYYLACNLTYQDDLSVGCESGTFVNNSLLELDVKTGEISLTRGVDIKFLLSVSVENFSELVVLFNGTNASQIAVATNSGKFFNVSSKKMWISPLTDLGYANKRKLIKEIFLRSKYDCHIIIKTEFIEKRIKVYGKTGVSRIPVNVLGSVIGIDFEVTDQNAEISNPQIMLELLGAR